MPDNKPLSKYTIELELADKTRADVAAIEKSFMKLGDSTKNIDFSQGMDDAVKQADDLISKINDISKTETDSTKQREAYNKAASKTIQNLENQATQINYSLSEQGKQQRERIKELQQELKALDGQKDKKDEIKQKEAELKELRKFVIDASDDELKNVLKQNKEIRAKLKLSQNEAKSQTSMAKLMKADIKMMSERLKEQMKFISALKTTEGRYNAIKKAAAGAGKDALTIGKGTAKVGAAALGGALALGGAAIASANTQVDREREANRIKVGGSIEEKQDLLGRLYIQTGADYTTIVDAINRVQNVLGSSSIKDIEQAANAEIRMPGAAAMFMQQNTASAGAADFTKYMNRMKAIQQATGASVEQITSASSFISNVRQSSFSNASMTDLQTLYLTLQNSGMFDSEDELQNAFNRFVREQKSSKKGVFELARDYDFTKGIYSAQNRTQAINAAKNINWEAVEAASKESSTETKMTAAEQTAMKMREMEETKNKILMKVLEAIYPIIDKLDISALQGIFNGLIDLVSKVVPPLIKILNAISPYIEQLVTFLSDTIGKIISVVETLINWIMNSDLAKWFTGTSESSSTTGAIPQKANGGLVTMPSLVGEAGAEMVIPLDYSRSARSGNIIQNLNQNFNMSGNETTTLSLMQAVKTRDFSRAMASNEFINRRLGR